MSRLIPFSHGNTDDNTNRPEWIDITALNKSAEKELEARSKVAVKTANTNKQVVVSRVCDSCHQVFSDSGLTKQKKKAVRGGQSFLTCPNCDGALRVYKTAVVAEKPSIQSVVKLSPDRKPGRVLNTWMDRASYGRMVHNLGKFCQSLKMTSAQIRFQRGIRAKHDGGISPAAAEFSIDYIDSNGTRNRIYTTTNLTPAGEFIAPKTFYVASGKEFPFTREALDQLESGKVFGPAAPYVPQARIVYRSPDPTRFPHVWSAKDGNKMKKFAARPEVVEAINRGLTFDEVAADITGVTQEEYDNAANVVAEGTQSQLAAVAAQYLHVGQEVTYKGKIWVVDRITDTGHIDLKDPDTGGSWLLPPEKEKEIVPTGVYRIGSDVKKLASEILEKEAARDEDTYIPVVETDPDYSVALQSETESRFDVPYAEMDQGVLPEEDRNYTTMFRANRLNLTKHAGKGAKDQVLWTKAEKAVSKSKYGEEDYWKVVSGVYQKMGGEFNKVETKIARDLDKTGPEGKGPGTGRGMGICTEEEKEEKKKVDKKATIKHEDGKWKVYNEAGTKLLGTHGTEKEAEKQLQAIEISKHKKGYTNPHDHQHPYDPKLKKFPKPDKKEMEEFDKEHPKKRADIQKTAEPTGYKEQDGKAREKTEDGGQSQGWPVEYDRLKKMLESLIRQSRTPIAEVDLHALKDNKYSRDDIVGFLDKMQPGGQSAFFPPTTASAQDDALYAALEDAINGEMAFNKQGTGEKTATELRKEALNDYMGETPREDENLTHTLEGDGDEVWRDTRGNIVHIKDLEGTEVWLDYGDTGYVVHKRYSDGYEEWFDDEENLYRTKDAEGTERFFDKEGNEIRGDAGQRTDFANSKLNLKKTAQDDRPALVDQYGVPYKPIEEEPEEEFPPVQFKERKIAPPGHGQTEVIPQPATEEQQQIWTAAQEFDTQIKAIDSVVTKAMQDVQTQIKALKETGRYDALVEQRQVELNKLGAKLDAVQDTVVAFKDNVLMLLQEKDPTLTQTQAFNILQELVKQHPTLQAAFATAKAKAQELLLAEKGVTKELYKYPKRTEKIQPRTVTAAFLDAVQELSSILSQIGASIARLNEGIDPMIAAGSKKVNE